MKNKLVGMILAAGYSSRMGDLKALLPFEDDTVIERTVKCFNKAGIKDVRIVVGHRADEIMCSLEGYSVQFIINENYPEGMYSSVQAGLKSIDLKHVDGFFLLPVDYPLIFPYTIELLMKAYNDNANASIIYPCYKGKRGHPPLISSQIIDKILCYNGDGGLRALLKQYEHEALNIEVGSDTILMDTDTKEDYNQALSYYKNRLFPTYDECLDIFKIHNVPQKVIEHGKRVADISRRIIEELNEKNYNLNADLAYYGGLIHDFCKGFSSHAEKGEEILRKMGYNRLSEIVGNHMDIDPKYVNKISEASVVYLADKLTKGTEVISIEKRIKYMEEKFKDKPEIIPYALEKLTKAKNIQDNIEETIKFSIFKLF